MAIAHDTRTLDREVDALHGKIVLPEHGGWDDARRAWNLAVDQRPAAVVFPESAGDVAAASGSRRRAASASRRRARATALARSAASTDTMLVRTTRLRDVSIDAEAPPRARRRRRPLAGGRRAGDRHGLTALHGSSPDVGVVGYSLGGGIGWLARRHGLATNSVTAIELVTADGERVRADADHDPELFWGLRGGGGNFGVVTAIEFALYPVEHA